MNVTSLFFQSPVNRCRRGSFHVWLALVCSLLPVTLLQAQLTRVWVGDGATAAWEDVLNWDGAVPGSTDGTLSLDTATFNSDEGPTAVVVDQNRSIQSMVFAAGAGAYTVGGEGAGLGNGLNLTSGGSITVNSGVTSVTTFHAPLVIQPLTSDAAGTYTFTNNATNVGSDANPYKLNFEGAISGGVTSSSVTLNLTGTAGSRQNNASGNNISGLISNGGAAGGLSVVVTGAGGGNNGAWALTNNANSYTGNTTVGAGTLLFSSFGNVGENSAIGAGDALIINSGAHAKYTGGTATTNRAITGNGGLLYNNGAGVLTLDGNISMTGSIIFRGTSTSNIVVNGSISGANVGVGRTDGGTNGTLFLNNNANSFAGNAFAQDGIISVATIGMKNQASALGAGTIFTFGQNSATVGRLFYTGATTTTDRDIRLQNGNAVSSGNGRLENHGTGILTWTGSVLATSSTAEHASSFELGGSANGVMSGVIGGTVAAPGNTTATRFSKFGAGLWELQAANNYSGNTAINEGTLLVTNVTGSGTGTSNVATSGSATLGGTGFVTGAAGKSLVIAAGSGLMVGNTHGTAVGEVGAGGYVGAVSEFTLGSAVDVGITLAGELRFDLFGASDGVTAGASDRLRLLTTATELTLGGSVAVANATGEANWRAVGGTGWTTGLWQLVDWSGVGAAAKNGTFSYGIDSSALAIGYEWDTSNFLTDGTISVQQIDAADIHIWSGAESNAWNEALNWTAGTTPTASNDVIFDAAGPTATVTNGDANVRNVVFTGAADYSISPGSGGVLYVRGNAVDGATIEVRGGIQTINSNLRFGDNSSELFIINNGVAANDGNSLLFTDGITANDFDQGAAATDKLLTISGSGNTLISRFERRHNTYDLTIVKEGSGTVTISGFNGSDAGVNATGTITGSMTINEGKVRINNERNLGGNPEVYDAGHLTLNGGVLGAFGNVLIDDENRGVSLGENGGEFEVEGTFTMGIANVISGSGSLTKSNTGTLSLLAANLYTGDTFVQGGTLNVGNISGSATGFGSVFVEGASMLSGFGLVAGKEGGQIAIGADAFLRVGNNHNNSSGVPGLLTLGSVADVGITLAGDMQFDLFGNEAGLTLSESDRLQLFTTAEVLTLGGTVVVANASGQSGWTSGTWQLIDWSGVDFDETSLDGGLDFDFTATMGSLATGFDWDVSQFLVDGTISVVATAGAFVWEGDDAVDPASWKVGGNWLSGVAPGAGDDVVFAGGTGVTATQHRGDQSFRNLIFTGERDYQIAAGTGGGVLFAFGDSLEVRGGTQQINAELRPRNGGTYNIINDGSLSITSFMTNSSAAVDIVFSGSGNTSVPFVKRRSSQVVNLIKNGSGTVTFNGGTDLDGDNGDTGFTASGSYITGTTTINEGVVRTNDERNLGGNPLAFNAAHLTINGGTLSAYANVTIDDANRGVTFGANGATLGVEQAADLFTVANVVTGAGGLEKIGPGILEFTAANTYSGDTLIRSGSFLANNTAGSATGSGSVSTLLDSGATLGGSGSISGGDSGSITLSAGTQLMVGSTHGVGGAPQTLTLGSADVLDLDVSLSGTLQFDLMSGVDMNDLLVIEASGELIFDDAMVLIAAVDSSLWMEGQTWKLIDWSGGEAPVGEEGLQLANSVFGEYFLTSSFEPDGFYVTASAVPEPGRALLLLLGLLGWSLRRRR